VEFTCLIIREFIINGNKSVYYIGINQIEFDPNLLLQRNDIDNEEDLLDNFLKIVSEVQFQFKDSIVQFIKNKYILNQDHVFIACYHLQKAFDNNVNISNKKNIELLLYLSANRQISKGIEAFGITSTDILEGNLVYCLISPISNLNIINNKLLAALNAKITNITINNQSIEKFNLIKKFYEFSEDQLTCIMNSYDTNENLRDYNLVSKVSALYDLICEQMVLLSLDNVKK
jgi:tRNA threonylcarbamoyladenosine modification (KEOPS) complex Cgi121 subunit